METKVSKAQIEVWDWKETLYEELKNIPKSERLSYIKGKVSETIKKINKKKTTLPNLYHIQKNKEVLHG
jgi:hypothetical protein